MALQEVTIGSVGPFLYDDASNFAVSTPGQLHVETSATDNDHVMRKGDMPALAGSTISDVTASRAFNTTYANSSSSRALMVIVTGECVITLGGGNAYMNAAQDTASPPTTSVTGNIGIVVGLLNEDNSFQLTFIVPAGTDQNYRVNTTVVNGSVTLRKWMEIVL